MPAQETDHQPQLRKTVLIAIPPLGGDDLIQHAGGVRRILEAQVLPEHNRVPFREGPGDFLVPEEQLRDLDVAVIQQQRHRRQREVERLQRGLEMNQAIAARNFKQPVAQMREENLAAPGRRALAETFQPRVIHRVVRRLIAVTPQPLHHHIQRLHAPVPVQLGHLQNHAGQHRMQLRIQREKIGPVAHEQREILGIGQIKSARKAREDEAGGKHIRQLIVVTTPMLPTHIARQINQPCHFLAGLANGEIVLGKTSLVEIRDAPLFPDDLERSRRGFLQLVDAAKIFPRRRIVRRVHAQARLIDQNSAHAIERRHATILVQPGDLLEERQNGGQHIVGAETTGGTTAAQENQKHGRLVAHGVSSAGSTSASASWGNASARSC